MSDNNEHRTLIKRTNVAAVGIQMAFDEEFTLEEKAVYYVLSCLPETWNLTIQGVMTITGLGKNKTSDILNKFRKYGYLYTKKQSDGSVISTINMTRPLSDKEKNKADASAKVLESGKSKAQNIEQKKAETKEPVKEVKNEQPTTKENYNDVKEKEKPSEATIEKVTEKQTEDALIENTNPANEETSPGSQNQHEQKTDKANSSNRKVDSDSKAEEIPKVEVEKTEKQKVQNSSSEQFKAEKEKPDDSNKTKANETYVNKAEKKSPDAETKDVSEEDKNTVQKLNDTETKLEQNLSINQPASVVEDVVKEKVEAEPVSSKESDNKIEPPVKQEDEPKQTEAVDNEKEDALTQLKSEAPAPSPEVVHEEPIIDINSREEENVLDAEDVLDEEMDDGYAGYEPEMDSEDEDGIEAASPSLVSVLMKELEKERGLDNREVDIVEDREQASFVEQELAKRQQATNGVNTPVPPQSGLSNIDLNSSINREQADAENDFDREVADEYEGQPESKEVERKLENKPLPFGVKQPRIKDKQNISSSKTQKVNSTFAKLMGKK